jgi:membrane-associated phospholipid phosphatase
MVQFLSDFADQSLVLPMVALIGLWLWVAEPWRTVVAWMLCCGFVLGTMFLLKMILPCTSLVGALRTPSGHTASATLVAGGIFVLLAGPHRRWRAAAVLGGIAVGAAIGATRLALGVHTPAEVLTGGVVGAVGIGLFAQADMPRPRLPPVLLIAAFAVVALLLHGTRLHAEEWINSISCRFR